MPLSRITGLAHGSHCVCGRVQGVVLALARFCVFHWRGRVRTQLAADVEVLQASAHRTAGGLDCAVLKTRLDQARPAAILAVRQARKVLLESPRCGKRQAPSPLCRTASPLQPIALRKSHSTCSAHTADVCELSHARPLLPQGCSISTSHVVSACATPRRKQDAPTALAIRCVAEGRNPTRQRIPAWNKAHLALLKRRTLHGHWPSCREHQMAVMRSYREPCLGGEIGGTPHLSASATWPPPMSGLSRPCAPTTFAWALAVAFGACCGMLPFRSTTRCAGAAHMAGGAA